jgi:hypothetical protein
LKYFDLTNLDYIPLIINTACLPHNFIIAIESENTNINGDELDDEEDSDDEADDEKNENCEAEVEKRDNM